MVLLRRLGLSRNFALPLFELAPLEFDSSELEEFLLDDVVASIGQVPEAAVPRAAVPTAGELQQSIERHLSLTDGESAVEAVGELRDALAQLRRSIG